MIALAAAATLAFAVALPHALRLDALRPGLASAIWLSALLLRALASLGAAVATEMYVPLLDPFGAWCVGSVSSHSVTDAVCALPTLALAGSLIWAMTALLRTSRGVRRLVRTAKPGPGGTLVIADGELLMAAAGLRRPQVVVSAGTLLALDDEELLAGLDHERGHIALRHRYLLVAGELARAVARLLPGTAAAARELVFSLEREADCFALSRRHEPAVLASAICKTAQGTLAPPVLALGGGVVARRARLLLEAGTAAPRAHVGMVAFAPLMICFVAAAALGMPFVAHADFHAKHRTAQICAHDV